MYINLTLTLTLCRFTTIVLNILVRNKHTHTHIITITMRKTSIKIHNQYKESLCTVMLNDGLVCIYNTVSKETIQKCHMKYYQIKFPSPNKTIKTTM